MENVRDIMRSPQNVLNSLAEHSKFSDYKFERLYRILLNAEMYHLAYQNIYAKAGNMTKGSDGTTIDQMSLRRIEKLMVAIRDESYQPKPSRRTYIPKKNGKKRPLGIPSFDDKLVQEVIRMILEAIYEGSFEQTSHGFRPNRSCHTAMMQIDRTFHGVKWFIEGDIKGFFDNINHDVLISMLRERVSDERFINLIRKFLNAGYVEDWVFHKTFSGTPQGGIISPVLANIYLDKLDKYMKEYMANFNKGEKRKINPEQKRLDDKRYRIVKKLRTNEDEQVKNKLQSDIRAIEKERVLTPTGDEMDKGYKRLKYQRYADDFLIGVIGSLADSKKIKQDIKQFLNEKLKLELSDEKTLITHSGTSAKFLSFDIYVRRSNLQVRNRIGRLSRLYNKKIVIKMPKEKMKTRLIDFGAVVFRHHNGKEQWKPRGRGGLIFKDDLEILQQYNAEIRGFYNYYSIALNAGAVNTFKYFMEYSMYKTFAKKYNSTVAKICQQYISNRNFTVSYKNKKGVTRRATLYNEGFKRKKVPRPLSPDNLPNTAYTTGRTSLIERLSANKCELCGDTGYLEMHHIKKMSDIKKSKKSWDVIMIARQRKTMAVCKPCHTKIHNGG